MEISIGNLNALFTSFDVIFQRGFEEPPSYYARLATVTRSASAQTMYPWLGQTTKFREWLGNRAVQNLEAHNYTITNKDFEDTIEINRNMIEDDQYGIFEPVIRNLGWDTKVHPDTLIFASIMNAVNNIDTPSAAGAQLAYDGVTFFSHVGHPVGLKNQASTDSLNPNCDNTGSGPFWYILDCSRPIRPFIFQMRREYVTTRMNSVTDEQVFTNRVYRYGVDARCATGMGLWQLAYASNQDLTNPVNYGAARAAMRKIKSDNGYPFGVLSNDKGVILLVPPALEEAGRQLLKSDFMVGAGASSTVSTTNIWKSSAELLVSEYLS
jgi:phage major head subunit gpT-like protein